MFPSTRRGLAGIALAGLAATTLAFGPQMDLTDAAEFAPQLVTVDTPTREHKELLQSLGLDLTEHAGHDYIEVVLHTPADLDALRSAELGYDVRIPDLLQREAERRELDAAYAARVDESPLPSGRDSYRSLADYEADIDAILETYPDITREVVLPNRSLEGRTIRGVEIGQDLHVDRGRPVFALMGLHHAREWPSGEHTIEFAFDLVQGVEAGDERALDLTKRARTIIIPVVNPDGFHHSYEDGQVVDLREVDGGGTVSILGTPSNAYKRKNCRIDGVDSTPPGVCTAAKSPGGFGLGVDLNRNYGTFHGGPGADANPADPTYHGPAPFSEPETDNIRQLVSSRQVTTLISNHTFSNLILRPMGVAPDTLGPDGHPVGFAPDEEGMKELGARMADQNGYANIHAWELYDTTGTTEDYSYNATGGYGYTFEIGPDEFHPPFEHVVDEYLGAGEYEGKGNREAYYLALENAANWRTHSVIQGSAPVGAKLTLSRQGSTPTWEGSFEDLVETTMTVGTQGKFSWHVNPSTRPLVQSRQFRVLAEEPNSSETFTGTTAPLQSTDVEYALAEDRPDLLRIALDWPTPDDMDLEVFRKEGEELKSVGSSAAFVGEKEEVLLETPAAGEYVIRVTNFASAAPQWTVTAETFDTEGHETKGLIEAWTLRCEVDGQLLEQIPVIVDRGEIVKADLKACSKLAKRNERV